MQHKILSAGAGDLERLQKELQAHEDRGWKLRGEIKVMRATREIDILVAHMVLDRYFLPPEELTP